MPDWFTRPEAIFRTILWFLGPFLTWVVGKFIIRRIEAWYAASSLESAKDSLKMYHRRLENPPTLLESVAVIVCFMPIPLALLGVGLFFSNPPNWIFLNRDPNDAELLQAVSRLRSIAFFTTYLISGTLTLLGFKTIRRLRRGEESYSKNYQAEMIEKIEKLKQKYPALKEPPKPTSS
jgi:hypothetical protein